MIQVLRPFKIQPSLVPLGPRLHRKDIRPGFGLAGGVGAQQAAVAEPGRYRCFCASVPKAMIAIVVVQSEAPVAKTRPVSAQPYPSPSSAATVVSTSWPRPP